MMSQKFIVHTEERRRVQIYQFIDQAVNQPENVLNLCFITLMMSRTFCQI